MGIHLIGVNKKGSSGKFVGKNTGLKLLLYDFVLSTPPSTECMAGSGNNEYRITNLEYRSEQEKKMNERRMYDLENRLIDFAVGIIRLPE